MPGVVIYTFNPSTKRQKQRHTELSVLQSKFQNSQDYTETPSFLNKQTNKQKICNKNNRNPVCHVHYGKIRLRNQLLWKGKIIKRVFTVVPALGKRSNEPARATVKGLVSQNSKKVSEPGGGSVFL